MYDLYLDIVIFSCCRICLYLFIVIVNKFFICWSFCIFLYIIIFFWVVLVFIIFKWFKWCVIFFMGKGCENLFMYINVKFKFCCFIILYSKLNLKILFKFGLVFCLWIFVLRIFFFIVGISLSFRKIFGELLVYCGNFFFMMSFIISIVLKMKWDIF